MGVTTTCIILYRHLNPHVDWMLKNDPGWGLHSERFLNYTLFPAIRQQGVEIVEHDTLCFFRARADGSVWITDCFRPPIVSLPSVAESVDEDRKGVVEKILGRPYGLETET